MGALLSQLISQLNSSVVVLLGILVLAAFVIFKLGRWQERFSHQDSRLSKVEDIHDRVIELSTKVDLIYNNTNPRALVASRSPLAVTEFGEKFSAGTNAISVFNKYSGELMRLLATNCPPGTNAYDIQQTALSLASSVLPNMLDATEINSFKQAAFENGILYEDIWPMFDVWLRDEALRARNIPVADIDRHDPTRDA